MGTTLSWHFKEIVRGGGNFYGEMSGGMSAGICFLGRRGKYPDGFSDG